MDEDVGMQSTLAGVANHRDGIPAFTGMTLLSSAGFAECRHPAEGREPWTRMSACFPSLQESLSWTTCDSIPTMPR